jgi:RimJ/RimL family protein N-acetyltransferase
MSEARIVTERLTLSPLVIADAPNVFRYRSDPQVSRYQTWEPESVDDARAFIEALEPVAIDTPGTWYQFGIRLNDSGLLVGDAGVHFPADQAHQAEIGISIAPEQQGRGLATEAVVGLLGYLFGTLHEHRVFTSADPRNEASMRLLERVGMRQEAHFVRSLRFRGEWADDVVFAILNTEWDSRAIAG